MCTTNQCFYSVHTALLSTNLSTFKCVTRFKNCIF
uniref:Uncharacterized protein n=1 Tax=Anguilla anguilla TaxID=7936 RepID=A0A0E9WND1_ANGAN